MYKDKFIEHEPNIKIGVPVTINVDTSDALLQGTSSFLESEPKIF